jgi:hypothetical protein
MIENLDEFRFERLQNPDPNAHQFKVESWKKQLD